MSQLLAATRYLCNKALSTIGLSSSADKAARSFFRYPLLMDRLRKIRCKMRQPRLAYIFGVLSAADLAFHLGVKKISAIEFGVATGKGLRALEHIAELVEQYYDISIEVYGFDTGAGLPKPQDYRDLPNLWSEGYFAMDEKELRKNLKRAKLFLGDVKDTVGSFADANAAPVGFVSFDMDLYSSTRDAFQLFDFENDQFLPRVHCYFDDVFGLTYGDCNGELLAIAEFNQAHKDKQISQIPGLKHLLHRPKARWPEQIYLAHFFHHELYGKNDGLLAASRI